MDHRPSSDALFKVCPKCRATWRTRDAFLSDRHVSLAGYQPNHVELDAGLFLFNHDVENCKTSLAIEANKFTDMHTGPIYTKRQDKTDACAGHCPCESDLQPCPNECASAYVRDVLQEVKKRLRQARMTRAEHVATSLRATEH